MVPGVYVHRPAGGEGLWWGMSFLPGPFHPLFMVSRERLFLSKSHFAAFGAVCKVFHVVCAL